MKKFILNLLIYFPVLIIIVAVNYFVDPGHRYARKNYEYTIVKMLDMGHVANVDDNFNDKRFKLFLAEHRAKSSVDILILGSSRTKLISEKLFPGKTCLNLSIGSADMVDEAGLYQACLRNQIQIKQVILLVDPDYFSEKNGGLSENTLEYDFHEYQQASRGRISSETLSTPQYRDMTFLKRIEDFLGMLDYKMNILSPSYFQETIRYLFFKKRLSLYNTGFYDNPGNTIHLDGSLSYNEKYRNQTQKEIDRLAMQYRNKIWEDYGCLSQQRIEELERLIDYIERNGSEVLIFNSCYHPYTYKRLTTLEKYKFVKKAMDFIPEFAAAHRLQTIGTFDPAKSNCDKTDFYDAMHMSAPGIEKIVSSFFEKSDSTGNRNSAKIHSTPNSR